MKQACYETSKKKVYTTNSSLLPTHKKSNISYSFFLTLIAIVLSNVFVMAQYTQGRIVVVKTAGTVSKAGSPIVLQEYATDGTPGYTNSLPSTGATPIQITTGSSGSEGFLTRSTDGTFLTLAGYATSDSYADIPSTASATVPRAIYKITTAGTFTQVGSSTTSYTGNDIRGAISDGTNYWASGASGATDGINYYGPGTPVALAVGAKAYGLQIFNGQIYYSTQKAGPTNTGSQLGIFSLGTGMPTSGTITPTRIINTGSVTPTDFSLNPTGDVCYVAINNKSTGGIQKWTYNGTAWTLSYMLTTGAGAYGLVVDYSGANPVLYATTFEDLDVGNRIVKITDDGTSSAGVGNSTASTLVSAGANNWFHGIAFSPSCPTPSQPSAFTASTATVTPGQSNVTYTVPNDASATSYAWSYSGTGATITGTGNSVTITFANNATAGTLSVSASNACGSSSARTVAITVAGLMRITEFMYNTVTGGGEFIELTNIGGTAIDMTGWSFDDDSRLAGTQSLTGFGIVKPGESVIFTESPAATFRSNWNLCNGIKIVGNNTTNLGRGDEINIFDASNVLVDRLTFDDRTGGPYTSAVSAWVNPAGLGTNTKTAWTLSIASDAEGSFASALGEIGSPGKSTTASVSYDPCFVANGTPTIVLDVASTTNYLDGGATAAPASPYGISGVLSDPTDPAKTLGLDFTIGDDATAVNDLTVTVASSNTAVVPNANISLTGSGSQRNVKINPATVGYSNITITVNDGTNNTSYIINFAASAASSSPANTVWHTGISDASDGIALDDNYYISGDDELNVLNVYSKTNSGLPLISYDYTSQLGLDPAKPEVDLEGGVKSPSTAGKVYWIGSLSNSKAPFEDRPNRNRIFATNVSGTGSATTFSFSGYYNNLRAKIIAWGDDNGYGFSASALAGVDSKSPSGFAVEGMVFGPDNTTLYIGMRAPMVPTANRTKAVIVPLTNFETWFGNGSPSANPTFGAPIELDLGGRGFRDLIRLDNGTYVIIAGNSAGSPMTSAIYKWSGHADDAPIRVISSADALLNMEGVVPVNENGLVSMTKLQVISDGGDDVLYNDGTVAKDFSNTNLRKFRSDILTSLDLCLPLTGDTTAAVCGSFTWYGTTYTASTSSATHTFTNEYGCDSIVTLDLTIEDAPVVNANIDQNVCSSVASIVLDGSVSHSTGQTWATSGSGTFSTASNLHASYTPSAADKTAGTVTLTLTAATSTVCTTAVADAMVVTFQTCTGVADMADSKEIQLVPNPTQGAIKVELSQNYPVSALSIYNMQGEAVKEVSISSGAIELQLDVTEIPAGVYTMILRDNKGMQVVKRMIKN